MAPFGSCLTAHDSRGNLTCASRSRASSPSAAGNQTAAARHCSAVQAAYSPGFKGATELTKACTHAASQTLRPLRRRVTTPLAPSCRMGHGRGRPTPGVHFRGGSVVPGPLPSSASGFDALSACRLNCQAPCWDRTGAGERQEVGTWHHSRDRSAAPTDRAAWQLAVDVCGTLCALFVSLGEIT